MTSHRFAASKMTEKRTNNTRLYTIRSIPFLPLIFFVVAGVALTFQAPEDRVYVGEQVCRQCHHLNGDRDQFNPWRQSAHSRAYAALSMPEASEIAALSGIEVPPHESPICLGCHVTAYDVEDWELDETFHYQDGIQCETCHGPGSNYIDADVMSDRNLAMAAGLKFPDREDCMVCHKEKGSHVAVLKTRPFVYEEAIKAIAHPGKGGPLLQGKSAHTPVLEEEPRFVGALGCQSCHGVDSGDRIYGMWRSSTHARAYATLGTDRAKVIASENGITGNPQEAIECLRCHTTGAGEPPGRFEASFDPAQGVQCESCHGPGSLYRFEAVMRDPVGSGDAGLLEVNRQTCMNCHDPGRAHGNPFDFEAGWKEVNHTKWKGDGTETAIEYKTPLNIAITRDGRRLFVPCEASNSLLVVDPHAGKVVAEVEVGSQPHHAALSPDEELVYVSNRGSDNVSIVDTKTYEVTGTIAVGDEPHEMVTDVTGFILYVTNAGSCDVSVVDLGQRKEIKRLAASRGPWGAARSPDGSLVYVTNNLPRFGEFRTTSMSEVTVIETNRSIVKNRITVPGANLIQGVEVSPNGEMVMVTLIRTKNLVPMTRNLQGWIITNGIGILWPDGRVDQLLLDEPEFGFSDPTDVVFSKDGKLAFVTGGGVRQVAVIDVDSLKALLQRATDEERREKFPDHLALSLSFVERRIDVGHSPRGMVVSPDNRFLYVADGLDDTISVIDIEKRERVRLIDLGGPDIITETRYGERIFHSADFTFARMFSCHSCHPDGHVDGITYDIEPDGLGINPVDNRTLRGINDTAPYKWEGTNPSLKRQCGPRLSAFFTRIDPFTPEQAAALDRYIVTIPRPPNRYRTSGELTPAQARGKRIFERQYDKSGNPLPKNKQCIYCHRPPYFTNREVFDIGSASWLDTNKEFDVPHLNNIYDSSPYLHDGRASSLEEIWTIYNPNDTHGVTNDLMKDELNDLIEYLKTL